MLQKGAPNSGVTRPVPRPTQAPAPAAQPNRLQTMFSRGPGGILPERGSQQQYDLVSSMVQSAMANAGNSGSPLLAALTPLLGGAVMSRTTGLRDQTQQQSEQDAMRGLYGNLGPEQMRLYDIASNENLPELMRNDARDQLRAAMTGGGTGGGGGGSRRGGGSSPSGEGGTDEMEILMGALESGETLAPDAQRTLVEMMRNPNATSQSRQWAQRLLLMHQQNLEAGAGTTDPAAAPQATAVAPQAPAAPALPAGPAAPMMGLPGFGSPPIIPAAPTNGAPPPPPGTVPY